MLFPVRSVASFKHNAQEGIVTRLTLPSLDLSHQIPVHHQSLAHHQSPFHLVSVVCCVITENKSYSPISNTRSKQLPQKANDRPTCALDKDHSTDNCKR